MSKEIFSEYIQKYDTPINKNMRTHREKRSKKMRNKGIYIIILLILINTLAQCQTKKEMPKDKIIKPDQDFWQAITTNDDIQLLAGDMGTLVWLSSEKKVLKNIKTDLDRPYIAISENGYVAIGQWNTRFTNWNLEYKEELSLVLFDGRSTGISVSENEIYVAGANKDTIISNEDKSNKDYVKLLPGILIKIDENGLQQKIEISTKGLITNLVTDKEWIAWVDDKEKNVLKLKRRDIEKQFYSTQGNIGAVCKADGMIYYADDYGVMQLDPLKMKQKQLQVFSKDMVSVLKMEVIQNKLYVVTSVGVLLLPEHINMSKSRNQPADISKHQDGVLILEKEGNITQIQKGSILKEYSIYPTSQSQIQAKH